MTTQAFDCDVLIVGYGPTGASLAALLGQAGVRTLVIDQADGIFPLPRAAHFDDEVMRIFQGLGASAHLRQVTRVSPAYEFRNAKKETLLYFDMRGVVTPSGWSWGYMIHQPAVEQELRRIAEQQKSVETQSKVRFVSLAQDAEGVTADVVGPEGGRTIRAKYLIGCDGAWSPVREACGLKFVDLGFDEPWIVLDVIVPEDVELPPHNLQICDPERPTSCVLMGPGRHRWEFMLKADETPEQVLQDDFIHRLLEPWGCAGRVEIERRAVYRFHALVADHWRQGRVLLAGDAAHQMPPFAGQGMCSGIRDASNLAWKLAAVCGGQASATLLDSFQTEREPHVRAVIKTAIAMGRMVCELDPAAAAARDHEMITRRQSGEEPVSIRYPPISGGCLMDMPAAGSLMPQPVVDDRRLDDLLGEGWVMITAPGVHAAMQADVPCFTADQLGPFAASVKDWLQSVQAPAVLVRPDRYVFGVGLPDALLAARADCLGAAAGQTPH